MSIVFSLAQVDRHVVHGVLEVRRDYAVVHFGMFVQAGDVSDVTRHQVHKYGLCCGTGCADDLIIRVCFPLLRAFFTSVVSLLPVLFGQATGVEKKFGMHDVVCSWSIYIFCFFHHDRGLVWLLLLLLIPEPLDFLLLLTKIGPLYVFGRL